MTLRYLREWIFEFFMYSLYLFRINNSLIVILGTSDYSDSQSHKKCNTRRREPRRHTLQNGVDCNMVNICVPCYTTNPLIKKIIIAV